MASRVTNSLGGFRTFILRGNVVDLAIGFIIGAAFAAVVSGLVTDIITPLIPAPGGSLATWIVIVPYTGKPLLIGTFINTVLSFLIIALIIYYFVVLPVNSLLARFKPKEVEAPATTRDCPYCVNSIDIRATRCPFCTSELQAGRANIE